jgi:AraC family transcriptional regulator of adaptative response/methylated-DNA-[protein]-cysteine methyltransferase
MDDYQIVAQAIDFLRANFRRQPSLAETAAAVGLSEFHFQRLFTRWAGISPKRFVQALTQEAAQAALRRAADTLAVTYASGLSSPSRLHDLLVTCTALTPAELRRRGEGVVVSYGFHPSPFGEVLLAQTARGVCGLQFVDAAGRAAALNVLAARWPRAELRHDPAATAPRLAAIFAPSFGQRRGPLALEIHGTNFQIQVWQALLELPSAAAITYGELARRIGRPGAARAVGAALGANPVAVLIPCHRVLRGLGELGGYRYGATRKAGLLALEWAQAGEVVYNETFV